MIPFAIFSGRLEFHTGEAMEIRAVELEPAGFTFYTAAPLRKDVRGVSASFYHVREDRTCRVVLHSWEITPGENTSEATDEMLPGTLYRLTSSDTEFIGEIRTLTSEYLEYIRLRSDYDEETVAEILTGLPREDGVPESIEEQFFIWTKDIRPDAAYREALEKYAPELGIVLRGKEDHLQWIHREKEDFLHWYGRKRHLEDHPLWSCRFACIGLGSEFDWDAMPDRQILEAALDHCLQEQITPICMLPPVREARMAETEQLLEMLSLWGRKNKTQVEIRVQDPGAAVLVSKSYGSRFQVTAGTLFCKRKKDTRLPYLSARERIIRENQRTAMDDARYWKWLREKTGITGMTYEVCEYPFAITEKGSSLVLPLYQMNTEDKVRDKGKLFPGSRHMVGLGNTLYGLDSGALWDGNYLKSFLEQGITRILIRF